MIWIVLGLLAATALAPLAVAVFAPPAIRGRAEADVALYRAQLAELDRERDAGRLDPAAHAAATLEVQRRLLAAPADAPATPRGKIGLAVALVAVPLVATGVYVAQGWPEIPSASFADRQQKDGQDETLLAQLRERLGALDPTSDAAVKGWTLLGDVERNRGRYEPAIAAYRRALAGGFAPEIAGQLAQTLLESGDAAGAQSFLAEVLPLAPNDIGLRFLSGLAAERGGRAADAKLAWGALLRDAPPDAPWRAMVERRLESLP